MTRHRRRTDPPVQHEHRRREDWRLHMTELWGRSPKDGRRHPLRAMGLLFPYAQWRVSQAIRQHPIQTAFVISTVVSAVFLALLLGALDQLRENTHDLRKVIVASQVQRSNTATLFCKALNNEHETSAAQNRVLTGILVSSVKQSRRYGPELKRLGLHLPSYAHQLAGAKAEARALTATVPPPIDCRKVRREVELHVPR